MKAVLIVVVAALALQVLNSCLDAFDSGGHRSGTEGAGGIADSCPERIATKIPDSEGAELVRAYHTVNEQSTATKQIVVCRTASGQFYYHGEYVGRPETALLMPAAKTDKGYVARNGPYRYEIRGRKVLITYRGKRIGTETLVSEPHPS